MPRRGPLAASAKYNIFYRCKISLCGGKLSFSDFDRWLAGLWSRVLHGRLLRVT